MVVQRKEILNRETLSRIFQITWKTEPQKLYLTMHKGTESKQPSKTNEGWQIGMHKTEK